MQLISLLIIIVVVTAVLYSLAVATRWVAEKKLGVKGDFIGGKGNVLWPVVVVVLVGGFYSKHGDKIDSFLDQVTEVDFRGIKLKVRQETTETITEHALGVDNATTAQSQRCLSSTTEGSEMSKEKKDNIRSLANQGDAEAQFILGRMYAKGQGVQRNDKKAVKWYQLVANQGIAEAQVRLGTMYEAGRGVPQDYKKAMELYERVAKQGNAEAQAKLGTMYAKGRGVPQNYKKAVEWYRLAADQGNAEAQVSLGVMYEYGQGVPQNYKEAVEWYRLATENVGAPGTEAFKHIAQTNLGVMYAKGRGVPQNYKEAVKWYRRAADKGFTDAQTNLGVMYAKGRGVPQNYEEAVKWYRCAAEHNAVAQHNLGAMYAEGRGVPQNYKRAYMWFSIAAANGHDYSESPRDTIAKKLSAGELEEAQTKATRCTDCWLKGVSEMCLPDMICEGY